MHNWRLLLFGVFAVIQATKSFSERGFIDVECYDRRQLFTKFNEKSGSESRISALTARDNARRIVSTFSTRRIISLRSETSRSPDIERQASGVQDRQIDANNEINTRNIRENVIKENRFIRYSSGNRYNKNRSLYERRSIDSRQPLIREIRERDTAKRYQNWDVLKNGQEFENRNRNIDERARNLKPGMFREENFNEESRNTNLVRASRTNDRRIFIEQRSSIKNPGKIEHVQNRVLAQLRPTMFYVRESHVTQRVIHLGAKDKAERISITRAREAERETKNINTRRRVTKERDLEQKRSNGQIRETTQTIRSRIIKYSRTEDNKFGIRKSSESRSPINQRSLSRVEVNYQRMTDEARRSSIRNTQGTNTRSFGVNKNRETRSLKERQLSSRAKDKDLINRDFGSLRSNNVRILRNIEERRLLINANNYNERKEQHRRSTLRDDDRQIRSRNDNANILRESRNVDERQYRLRVSNERLTGDRRFNARNVNDLRSRNMGDNNLLESRNLKVRNALTTENDVREGILPKAYIEKKYRSAKSESEIRKSRNVERRLLSTVGDEEERKVFRESRSTDRMETARISRSRTGRDLRVSRSVSNVRQSRNTENFMSKLSDRRSDNKVRDSSLESRNNEVRRSRVDLDVFDRREIVRQLRNTRTKEQNIKENTLVNNNNLSNFLTTSFYILQAIYLCHILIQIIDGKPDKKKSGDGLWKYTSRLVKVD